MIVYCHDNYKAILKNALLEKKETLGSHYSFQKMALACRIEKAYLSRALNGDVQLSLDQLYLACQFLGFSAEERRYVQLLLQYERSAVAGLKEELLKEINNLRKHSIKSEDHIQVDTYNDSAEFVEYFLEPNSQLVHMLLTTKKYGQDPRGISRSLQLPIEKVLELIAMLERHKLVEFKKGRYHVLKSDLHLSAESRYYKPYRLAARMKSMERLQNLSSDEGYSFSVTFSSTPEIRNRIHEDFMKFLSKVRSRVQAGEEEEVYQMNFDLFPWT